jgi:hypothetical protein
MNKAIHMLPAQRVEPSSSRVGASVVASAVGGIVLALSGMPSQAALVTLCGNTICYEYNDDPGVNAGITLYGSPTLLANSDTLKFAPTAFEADSDPGTPAIPTPTETATFLFNRVYAKNGTDEIGTIEVSEDGDYQILGDASVSANLRVQVIDIVDDPPVTTPGFPETIVDNQLFSSSTPTGLAFQQWSLGSMVSPATVFTDLASNVELSIQNTLQAFSGSEGGYAYIAKKLLLTVSAATPPTNTEVPVPAAAWLFASGLGAMGWFRRRKAG